LRDENQTFSIAEGGKVDFFPVGIRKGEVVGWV